MRAFYLLLRDEASAAPRRVDFKAESPDHAFQIARNERDGIHVELWETDRLLAKMTKAIDNVWELLPSGTPDGDAPPDARRSAGLDVAMM